MVADAPSVDIPASAKQPGPNGHSASGIAGNGNIGVPVPSYPVTLTINGTEHTLRLEAWVTLLDLLRDRLDLTGTNDYPRGDR